MDHVPRVPVRRGGEGWRDADILAGLNLLVDECLKRTLWRRQGELAAIPAAWWAPHAPEPVTLVAWLHEQLRRRELPAEGPIRIVHPDPPISAVELGELTRLLRVAGLANPLEVLTPRQLAAGAS
jgi:hypothetical protein